MSDIKISSSPFLSCVTSILDSWSSLNVGLSNGCAGSYASAKKAWLPGAVVDWLGENNGADIYELEDTVETILFQDFNLSIEDNTIHLVCSRILDAQALCQLGKTSEAFEKYCNKIKTAIEPQVTVQKDDSSDSDDEMDGADDDEHMMETSTTAEEENNSNAQNNNLDSHKETQRAPRNQQDEDGWTTVTKTHKKK